MKSTLLAEVEIKCACSQDDCEGLLVVKRWVTGLVTLEHKPSQHHNFFDLRGVATVLLEDQLIRAMASEQGV